MPVPSNVRFVGPILDGPALTTQIDELAVDDGRLPLVLISLSTSHQGQVPVLQRLIDALGQLPVRVVVTTGPAVAPEEVTPAPNTTVVGFVPHQQVLPKASLVVTHAGLGTVMTALSHGVPLLCLPMGRDQFYNAAQVEALGAGRMIPADTDAGAVAGAVEALLGADSTVRDGAKRVAQIIAGYRGADAAADELERLARTT